MAERLADVKIDADGEEIVFRVTPGGRFRSAFDWMLRFAALSEAAKAEPRPPIADPAIIDERSPRHVSAGATPKPGLRLFDAATDKAIATAYLEEGLSIPDLVKRFGGTQTTIGRALDREKVVRRSTSESLRLSHSRRKAAAEQTSAAPAEPPTSAMPQGVTAVEKAAPLPGRSDERPDKKTTGPGNKGNGPTRAKPPAAPFDWGVEIERLYLDERMSPQSIAHDATGRGHSISLSGVMAVLRRRKVPIRSRSEAAQLSRMERGLPVHGRDIEALRPKPKQVEIPATAKRVTKTVAELTPEPVKHKSGRDALSAHTGVAARRAAQARNPLNLSDEERQAAVNKFLEDGGAITVVQAVDPAAGQPRPTPANVGRYEGKRR